MPHPLTHPRQRCPGPGREGVTVFETVVAFSLLVTVLGVTAPLMVRHGRLLADQRSYRLAVDELTNQVDRLTALPAEAVRAELPRLAPSAVAGAALAGATLTGRLEPADLGQRLTLTLAWPETNGSKPPVTLVGWVLPSRDDPDGDAAEATP